MKSMKAKTSLTLKNIFNLDLNLNDNLDYLGLKGQELFLDFDEIGVFVKIRRRDLMVSK